MRKSIFINPLIKGMLTSIPHYVLVISLVFFLSGCELFNRHSVEQALTSPAKEEISVLDKLLNALSLKKQDLGIQRSFISKDSFLLNKVPLFLNSPLQTISFVDECEMAFNKGGDSISSWIDISARLLEMEIRNIRRKKIPIPEEVKTIPESPIKQAIEILYPALVQGKEVFDEAFIQLNQENIDFLKNEMESLLSLKERAGERYHYQNQARIEKAYFLSSQINRKKILEASHIIASALDEALNILRAVDSTETDKNLKEESTILHTPFGEIIIGGNRDNNYEGKMPLLLIDQGGNDRYHFDRYSPFSVIIDLSGNDIYYSTENGWLGTGVMGIGFLIDLKGDDLYQGKNYAFGAGFWGVGFLFDGEGNDRYLSGIFTQGAGAFGLGVLCDTKGDDLYQTVLYGQGFGFVGGGGFLLDHQGNDKFFSGGVVPDHREESGAYQTYSQGFGLGDRPFASGGLGILYNGEGDDVYEGSYFCQGSAYWLSIGLLIDRKGNDRYKARRYSQGAGIHWAVGALIDREGRDGYTSWGVSQGCGHDFSVGILLDQKGNDHYHAEWLSQGAGNDMGRGLLIDEEGNDLYEAGTDGTQGCGKYNTKRDEGSVGLLIDRKGRNTFSGQGRDKRLWKNGYLGGGIAYQGSLPAIRKETFQKDFVLDVSFSAVFKDISRDPDWKQFILPELEGLLSLEREGMKAAEALSKKGPSIIPALLKYLEIKDAILRAILEETFKIIAKTYLEDIHLVLQNTQMNSMKKSFLLSVIGDNANSESKKIFFKFLKDEDGSVQAMSLRGLYRLKEAPPVEGVNQLYKSKNLDVKRYLCLSLQFSQDLKLIPVLTHLQNDTDFNIRFAATESLNAIQLKKEGDKQSRLIPLTDHAQCLAHILSFFPNHPSPCF